MAGTTRTAPAISTPFFDTGKSSAPLPTGRIAAAARADYAAFSLTELAAEISRQSGREITYPKLSGPEYHAFMVGEGVAAADADQLLDADRATARGELAHTPGDLRRLIGRPTTPIADSIATALDTLGAQRALAAATQASSMPSPGPFQAERHQQHHQGDQ